MAIGVRHLTESSSPIAGKNFFLDEGAPLL